MYITRANKPTGHSFALFWIFELCWIFFTRPFWGLQIVRAYIVRGVIHYKVQKWSRAQTKMNWKY